jgi:hypothetical protein
MAHRLTSALPYGVYPAETIAHPSSDREWAVKVNENPVFAVYEVI